MTITSDTGPEVRAELARQAATHGVGLDAYATSLIESAAQLPKAPVSVAANPQPSRQVIEAIETLKAFGKAHRLSLGGMTMLELRHEAAQPVEERCDAAGIIGEVLERHLSGSDANERLHVRTRQHLQPESQLSFRHALHTCTPLLRHEELVRPRRDDLIQRGHGVALPAQ